MVDFLPKVKIELAVDDVEADQAIRLFSRVWKDQ